MVPQAPELEPPLPELPPEPLPPPEPGAPPLLPPPLERRPAAVTGIAAEPLPPPKLARRRSRATARSGPATAAGIAAGTHDRPARARAASAARTGCAAVGAAAKRQ